MRSFVSSQHSRPPNFVRSGGPGDRQLLHEWLLVLRGDGKSKMTIDGYHNSLKQLVAFVKEGGYPSLTNLSVKHLREWLNASLAHL